MDRRQKRIEIMTILYEVNLKQISPLDIFAERDVLDKDIKDISLNIYNNKEEIDDIIKKNLTKYTIDRLNLVDLAILELATYELKYTKLDYHIIINEALEISRSYSYLESVDSVKFNNSVLDKITTYLGKK